MDCMLVLLVDVGTCSMVLLLCLVSLYAWGEYSQWTGSRQDDVKLHVPNELLLPVGPLIVDYLLPNPPRMQPRRVLALAVSIQSGQSPRHAVHVYLCKWMPSCPYLRLVDNM